MERFWNLLALASLLVLLPGTASAITSYDVAVHGESADINVTVELFPENPDRETRLSTSWLLPQGTEVSSVSDSDGELDYEMDGSQVRFETTIDRAEDKEVVRIQGEVPDVVEEEFRELDLVQLQLSGFRDRRPDVPEEVTQVQITTDRPVFSESHSFGFDASLGNHGANYSGEGPVNLRMTVSDSGEEYENFVLFGPGNLSTADDLYWVPAAVTGFVPDVNRFPVVVYPDDEYDRKVDAWSAGQYRTGGLIFVRESSIEKDKGPGVVMHELMHGFNAQALEWTSANRAWFDEGTAKYVEWLVNEKRGLKQAEIFGEEVTWREGRTRYTLPPRGEPEDLIEYYRNDRDFMHDWNVRDYPERRTFGYAYSELVIRNQLMDNGPDALRPTYRRLQELNEEQERQVDGIQESNQIILDIMGADFEPCRSDSREQVENCLERVNDMEAEIPELGELREKTRKVEIKEVEQPQHDPVGGIGELLVNGTSVDDTSGFFQGVLRSLQDLVSGLLSLLR